MSAATGGPVAGERVAVGSGESVAPAVAVAMRVARASGLPPATVATVRVVASELAENLHRHARGGELVAVPPWGGVGVGRGRFCVYAIDRGDGVEFFERCFVDGYTTTGTMGTGLGAVRRMGDDVDAVSEPGYGTIVRAAFAGPHATAPDQHFAVGAFGLPIDGQIENGDDFGVIRHGSRLVVMLADGLGHGPGAAIASGAAIRELGALPSMPPAGIVTEVSRRIGASRGAAVTVASLELDTAREGGMMQSAGLGNVALLVAGPDAVTHRVATSHGTAGVHNRSHLAEQSTAFAANGLVILHSDGLSTRWDLEGRAELLRHAPDIIAAALWRDHGRNSDDSLVVVVRARPRTSRP